jgi:soluble lytic murein transglycosylase
VEADLSRQRVTFLKAEKALNAKQYRTFDKLMPELEGYPLYTWLQYRRLRKTISLKQADNISEFLQREVDSRYAAPLKRSWLNYLAKKRRWADYVNSYEPQRNQRYQCDYYWGLKQLGEDNKALFGARDLWLVGRSQPKACNALFDWFQKSSLFTSALVWQRIELAMGAGKSSLADYLGRFLPPNDQSILKQWLKLHRNPRALLDCPNWDKLGEWKSKIFVHAVLRLMRKEPRLALQVWEAEKEQFDLEVGRRMPVDNRLALKLALRKNPLARKQLAKIPNEQSSSAVREWRVREALAQQAWPAVESAIERLPEQERGLPRWRYWLARAKEAQGERLNVDETYLDLAQERSYYGFMASDRINRHYSFVDRPVEVDKQVLNELALRPDFQVVKELLYFKRETEARRQWWFAIKDFDQKQLVVASKLAQRWRWHQVAILTTARGKYWDDLSLRFPASYASLIEQNARSKNLDKALVYGIIRRESAFDRYARSPVGARGLMQIMPATGKEIARRLKEKWRSSTMLYKPEVNLHFGTDYFQQLLQKFDGNPVLAMAAYNAGGHRVNRWLPQKTAMDADSWIDTIPYKETRQYVSTILTYAVIYQRQLKQPASRISAYMPPVAMDEKPRKIGKTQPKRLKSCH